MPTRLAYRIMGLVLCTALLCMPSTASAGAMSANKYLALKKSLGATSPAISVLKSDPAAHIGRTVDLAGAVSGIARCGESVSFILNCDGESILVKANADLPDCVANGNTIRVLVKIGPGCIASLSDLQLEGAAYDYDVRVRERQLAPQNAGLAPQSRLTDGIPPKAGPQVKQPSPPGDRSPGRAVNLSSRGADFDPAARIREIYGVYRAAIARFNPRLSGQQLDTITRSILAFSWRYRIDPRLVVAIFLVESGFKPGATSPKGAMGLGQLMPGTARGLGVGNAYDPVQNIEASIRLIRGHLDRYGDLALALSAYNAGPGAVRKYGGVPPYRETQGYIQKVTQLYRALCGSKG